MGRFAFRLPECPRRGRRGRAALTRPHLRKSRKRRLALEGARREDREGDEQRDGDVRGAANDVVVTAAALDRLGGDHRLGVGVRMTLRAYAAVMITRAVAYVRTLDPRELCPGLKRPRCHEREGGKEHDETHGSRQREP